MGGLEKEGTSFSESRGSLARVLSTPPPRRIIFFCPRSTFLVPEKREANRSRAVYENPSYSG